ncbi:MAG TPA: EAL domain-containing protein [Hyphomonas sp.]|nr:EAL domain-containing protein [Hyphomonas sp.]
MTQTWTATRVHSLRAPAIRFDPVLDLSTGEAFGMAAELPFCFEEGPAFGPARARQPEANAAKWLAERIGEIASYAHEFRHDHRPIIVPSPVAALSNPDTALACDMRVRRTSLCQQEFCLEFTDTAFAGDAADCTSRIAHLRRHGFRVSVDMRKSWQTPIAEGMRLLIDTLRVDARKLDDDDLADACEVAAAAGIMVIAEHASWRDAENLARLGISAAIKPRTDA